MHPQKIEEKINTLKAYQHICHLQLEKARTGHDFSDLLSHYKDKIEHYENKILHLEEQMIKETKKRLILGIGGAKIAVIAIFVTIHML